MQAEIHPAYHAINVQCSCGHKFEVGSTLEKKDLHLEVCSECHPFYTGKQKIVDTAGRVENFKQKYAFLNSALGKNTEKSPDETKH